ncbi:unnamed protein product [Acanthoscelides obtectus]|uniref:Uncharacterized protein n=1 Tax=Acanthoscelides obtectus TaxID=200917 RepID=A0A9P0JUJ6_ACAOB|nr:unnamed protein product [Acanthoscelides obtectus]CAK1663670.1 hypothetical protein AOBTE_LOCUS23790 [Acanthoscelides obtectus]
MSAHNRYLSDKDLEEIVRRYEREEEDSDYTNNDLGDSGSEAEDHEEEEVEADEIVSLLKKSHPTMRYR